MKTCNVWPLDDHYAIAADDRDTNTRREHGAALLASEWQALSLMLERKEMKKRLKQSTSTMVKKFIVITLRKRMTSDLAILALPLPPPLLEVLLATPTS